MNNVEPNAKLYVHQITYSNIIYFIIQTFSRDMYYLFVFRDNHIVYNHLSRCPILTYQFTSIMDYFAFLENDNLRIVDCVNWRNVFEGRPPMGAIKLIIEKDLLSSAVGLVLMKS